MVITKEDLKKRVNRKGWNELWDVYYDSFILSPASVKYHSNYEGGLYFHSVLIYRTLRKLNVLSKESAIVCAFLHDLCKVGAYNINKKTGAISYNSNHPAGHSILSLQKIKSYMNLTEEEELIIKYHMSFWGVDDHKNKFPEYSFQEWKNAVNKYPSVMIFATIDLYVTRYLE